MFTVSVKWRRGGQDRSLTVWMPHQSPQMSDAGVETRPPSQVRESHSSPTGSISAFVDEGTELQPQLKNMHDACAVLLLFLFFWCNLFLKRMLKP